MNIDKENPDIFYLSVNRDSVFEIERWTTRNNGRNWSVEPITQGSTKNNVRPFAVRGAKEGNPIQVLWMQNTKYIHFSDAQRLAELGRPFYDRFHSSIKMDRLSPAIDSGLSGDDIVNIMHRVADWQFANPIRTINELDWHYGAFYTGIRALYETTGVERYKEELINMGDAYGWKPMNDIFHADRLLIIDIWAWLYQMEKRPEMIDKSKWALDIHLARILNYLPQDYKHHDKFVKQYQEMAHKLLSLQGEDGLWRVSLIDPDFLDIGESSGSSFFTYALAWGINNGLIDAQYRPAIEKAWLALTRNVNAEGRLGFVQQVAGDPYPFYEHQWHVYASGAFIMAGSEIIKMQGDD